MRSAFKSGLAFLALASLVAAGTIVGCSADGGDQGSGDQDSGPAIDNGTDSGDIDSTLGNDTGADAGTDTGSKDTGSKDTSVQDTGTSDAPDAQVIEAGQDAGPQGSACTPLNQIQQQTCGLCGFQTRTCLQDPDASTADAGEGGTATSGGAWGPWGFCQGEVPGGCTPGSTAQEACGLCGNRTKICQNDCTYAVGSCQGQPTGACQPGTTDFQVGLSCDVGGRSRTCSDGGTADPGVAACTYGNYGGCYIPEGGTTGASLTIATTAGTKATGTFNILATQTIARLGAFDTCPNATISTTVTPYQYVEVHNPTGMTAKVSIWGSKATGGQDIDTIMAVYNGFNVPTTTTARMACSTGVADDCADTTDPTSCLASWGGLMMADGNVVTIGPFNSAIVYTAAYYAPSSTNPTSGPYVLTARTESIQ